MSSAHYGIYWVKLKITLVRADQVSWLQLHATGAWACLYKSPSLSWNLLLPSSERTRKGLCSPLLKITYSRVKFSDRLWKLGWICTHPRSWCCNDPGIQNIFPRSSSFIIHVFLWFKNCKHMETRWKMNQKDNRDIAMCPVPCIEQKIPRKHKPFGDLACNVCLLWWEQTLHELVCCRSYWGQPAVCNECLVSLTWSV